MKLHIKNRHFYRTFDGEIVKVEFERGSRFKYAYKNKDHRWDMDENNNISTNYEQEFRLVEYIGPTENVSEVLNNSKYSEIIKELILDITFDIRKWEAKDSDLLEKYLNKTCKKLELSNGY